MSAREGVSHDRFPNIKVLDGGIMVWKSAGYPVL